MSWVLGLDVSAAQGVIDWSRVPRSYEYVICKASEGTSYKDPTRLANMKGAHASGRQYGDYAFLRVSQGDGPKQAVNLWEAVGDEMPDLVPALDLEAADDSVTPEQLVYFFLSCADAVEEHFGRPPMVYTYPWFERSRIAPAVTSAVADRLARCPLWMADYSGGELPRADWRPFVPAPWTTWCMAQTSGNNSSHVPGINGPVDHDVYNGDMDAWRTFLGLPATTPADEPTRIVHPPVDFPDRDPQT